ncbi:MAG: hypothetical protein HY614_06720 [Candidatus Rokubacteria bacterium]|nr:hypothetical protein [Candidatus Rokubacteria bacterium]
MFTIGEQSQLLNCFGGKGPRAVLDRYNIISEDDVRTAVQKTSAYVASLPATPTVVPLRTVEACQK